MKMYKYGKATIALETKDIHESTLSRLGFTEEVPESFEFDIVLGYSEEDGALFKLETKYGELFSYNIDGPIGISLASLEEMFNTLSFDQAIETVNAVMKTLTGNDPEVT